VKPVRELWARINPSLNVEEKGRLIEAASKLCQACILDPVDVTAVKGLGFKTASARDADITIVEDLKEAKEAKKTGGATCITVTVKSRDDEASVARAAEAGADYIILRCPNWEVIPIENIIASVHGKSRLLALIPDAGKARLTLEALEIGVDGVVVENPTSKGLQQVNEVLKTVKTRVEEKKTAERMTITPAEVIASTPLGIGARVCVDTCDLMKQGEGMLVGCQSSSLFLVQAEVYENPHVEPRPFRVNAGPVSHYTLTPGGKTRYLSELGAGKDVLIVDREGMSRAANVCRVKVEWRPLILVEALCQERVGKVIVQNAETIRFVTREGSKSVTELKPGDEILAHVEEGGRHFGTLVKEETVIER